MNRSRTRPRKTRSKQRWRYQPAVSELNTNIQIFWDCTFIHGIPRYPLTYPISIVWTSTFIHGTPRQLLVLPPRWQARLSTASKDVPQYSKRSVVLTCTFNPRRLTNQHGTTLELHGKIQGVTTVCIKLLLSWAILQNDHSQHYRI